MEPCPRYTFQTRASTKNTSGRTGVYRTTGRYPSWVALWQDPVTHTPRRRLFSVSCYGEADAYRRAVAARAAAERELIERFGLPGVHVQRCEGTRTNGWQVRWNEPVSEGFVPVSIFFSLGRYGERTEAAAHAFAERVRRRLAEGWT